MAKLQSGSVGLYTQHLGAFGGVDFSSGQAQVASHRSPDALNMISDEKCFPVKRTGFHTHWRLEGPIRGLHHYAAQEQVHLLAHSGTRLYALGQEGQAALLCEDMKDAPSQGFVMGGALYLLDGQTYRKVWEQDGTLLSAPVRDGAFVPTTSIAKAPSGAGTAFEPVNLLTPRRKNSFIADGVSTLFQLDGAPARPRSAVVTVNGVTLADTAFALNTQLGQIVFESPPAQGNGVDNVLVEFDCVTDQTAVIDRCTVCGIFGGKNDTRVFLSGNPDQKNVDWQSGLYDPSYFPDTGYTAVGSDASAIMGYARQYDAQIILKEGNGQDATQWLRTFELDSQYEPRYPLSQGAAGAGAIAKGTFATLGDEPLFLSEQGVYAVAGTSVERRRAIQNRSLLLGNRLASHAGKGSAVACEHEGKYYLALEGCLYIADGAQQYLNETGIAQYEWYFWQGLPATALLSHGGRLWIGTQDGRVACQKHPEEMQAFSDDGQAYDCWWTVPLTAFGDLRRHKSVYDLAYMLMPYSHSLYQVKYRTDEEDWQTVREGSISLMDFGQLWFDDWSFSAVRVPALFRVGRRKRRAQVFQARIESGKKDTGFGLLGIEICYRPGRRVEGGV